MRLFHNFCSLISTITVLFNICTCSSRTMFGQDVKNGICSLLPLPCSANAAMFACYIYMAWCADIRVDAINDLLNIPCPLAPNWSLDYALCTRLLLDMASYCGMHQVQEAAWKEAYCLPVYVSLYNKQRAGHWEILLIHWALAALCCYHLFHVLPACLFPLFPYLFFLLVLLHMIISCSWMCRYVKHVASQTFLCLILMWSPAVGLFGPSAAL